MSSRCHALLLGVIIIAALPQPAAGQGPLQGAAIVEHLGATIPPSVVFADENGRPVSLAAFLGGKPLVISLAYFTCPMLCHLGQDGAADAFRDSGSRLGRDFRALTISIDPRDRPADAREWRTRAADRMRASAATLDWHFLVGDETNIRRLADVLGFRYAFDRESGQFSHAAALFVIGADGRVSQYVYGITFDAADIAHALAAAGANRRVATINAFLMRCFHYVPAIRRHGGFVVWLLRAGGLLVTGAIASTLLILWRREARA